MLCSLFGNKTFRDIAISLAGTYGLYLIGSIVHLEVGHLFTSFVQYLFFLPSCESIHPIIKTMPLTLSRLDVNILSRCLIVAVPFQANG